MLISSNAKCTSISGTNKTFTSSILQSVNNLSYLHLQGQCVHYHLSKIVWYELKLEYFQVTVGLQTWHYKTRSLQRESNANLLKHHNSQYTEWFQWELVENSHVLQTVCSIHCTCHGGTEQMHCERWLGEWCHFSVSCTSQSSVLAVFNAWRPAMPWIVAPRRNTFTFLTAEKTNMSCVWGTGVSLACTSYKTQLKRSLGGHSVVLPNPPPPLYGPDLRKKKKIHWTADFV